GYVYYGQRFPELHGRLIYGDYDSGKVWSFLYKDGQATEQREIADSDIRIVSFGRDAQGELYLIDHQGIIEEIVPAPPVTTDAADFPRQLSETGLFTDIEKLTPAPGVIPYSINAEPWYDGAVAERHFAIPSAEPLEYMVNDIKDNYLFPVGTVLAQTLSIEMETGNPASSKRIETRLLHYDSNHWRFYSYAWNDEQTDATLVPKTGDGKLLSITDASAPGGKRNQIWAIPARSQCATCHVRVLDYAIGFKTPQLNRDHDYGDGPTSQLAVFDQMGLFGSTFRKAPGIKERKFDQATRLTDPTDTSASVTDRTRAYLHANCSHCHQPGGGGQATIDLRYHLSQAEMQSVDATPAVGDFEIPGARIVKPGDPAKSVLHHRMNMPFTGRMPLIGSFVVDREAVKLIERWIREMK
ncbi:MAG: PQQ-dependent sugar dehydrogenase, partial [Planctomycetota bacterium]